MPALRLLRRLVLHLFSVVVSLDYVSPTAILSGATKFVAWLPGHRDFAIANSLR